METRDQPTPVNELYDYIFLTLKLSINESHTKDQSFTRKQLETLIHNTEHRDFLVGAHEQQLTDRDWLVQYRFCVLWQSLATQLYRYNLTVTKEAPMKVWFSLLRGQEITDSYLIFLHEQIQLLLKQTQDRLWRELESNSSTAYLSRNSIGVEALHMCSARARAAIHVWYCFKHKEDKIWEKFCMLNAWADEMNKSITIEFQMLRMCCLWIEAITASFERHRLELEPTKMFFSDKQTTLHQRAADALATLEHIYHDEVKILLNEVHTSSRCHVLAARAVVLCQSALIETLVIKAEKQSFLKDYVLATSCYILATTRYNWQESPEAKHISSLAVTHSKTGTTSVPPDRVHEAEPIGKVTLMFFTTGQPLAKTNFDLTPYTDTEPSRTTSIHQWLIDALKQQEHKTTS